MTEETFDHERAAGLLPWLASGTLEGEERERVERHVRHCLPCRAELAEQRALMALVRRQPAVQMSPEAGFERLSRRIDSTPPRRTAIPPRTLWALAAAAAIAGVGWTLTAGLLGPEPGPEAAAYGTLSNATSDGALIDVIFTDGVREAEMRELLTELGAEIVAGPSRSLGRYTLRIPASRGVLPDVDAVVRRLLGDDRVRFAGPTFSPQQPSEQGAGSASRLKERAVEDAEGIR